MDTDAYTCGTCKHGCLHDQCRKCEDAFEQARKPSLKDLVCKVHAAKGRHHNQIAMCNLYDACGLPNIRPNVKA